MTRIVKFVPTRNSTVKIERSYTPFRVVNAKIKEDCISVKQLEVWVNVSKNTLKIMNRKLNLNMNAVLYINILSNTITARKLNMI